MVKVLIAEDDLMIADMVEQVLVDNEYEVCGIARTVAEAVALCRRDKPDLAVIDMRLADGDLGTEAAVQLRRFGRLGVLFATGQGSQVKLSAAEGDACLAKPYRWTDLLRSLEIVAEIAAKGTASPPFPRGLRVLATAAPARRSFPPG